MAIVSFDSVFIAEPSTDPAGNERSFTVQVLPCLDERLYSRKSLEGRSWQVVVRDP
jgi:hypothetical protein